MHWIAVILRLGQAVFYTQVFFCFQASSTPALHPPLTQAVGRLLRYSRTPKRKEETKEVQKHPINNRATRIYASTLGVLVGLAGVEHGIFEVLQGNVWADGIMIDAIGPDQRLWEYATETALTIIPNFLFSGILSIVIGSLVVIWACVYVNTRYGAIVLLFLSIALFLVGGGFVPIFLTVLAFLAATRIHSPLKFWRSRVPVGLRNLISKLWPWALIVSVISFVVAVEIAIFGQPMSDLVGADTAYQIQFSLGLLTLILSIVALPAAYARDANWPLDLR